MHFDFPIETIKFDFEHQGTGQINLYFNNKKIENYLIEHKDINKSNWIESSIFWESESAKKLIII